MSEELQTISRDEPTLMEIIREVAARPGLESVEVLERLVALKERTEQHEAEKAFARDLAALQAELPQINKDGRIVVGGVERSRYSRLEDIDATIRPLLAKYGFAMSFDEEESSEKGTRFILKLSHHGGHSEIKKLTVPTDKAAIGQRGPIRTPIQDSGSTVSYARRYLIKMMLNLIERDEDNDGHGKIETISEDEAKDLEIQVADSGMNKDKFLVYMRAGTFSDILATDREKAQTVIRAAIAERQKK